MEDKMYDMGTKEEELKTASGPVSQSKEKDIYYPRLYLNTEELPALKGFSVGDKIKLILEPYLYFFCNTLV